MTLIPSVMAYSSVGLLALRVVLGAIFIIHGKMKLGMWKAQPSEQMPAGQINLMKFLSVAEIAGGVGVLLGLLTQWAALGLCVVMLGAIYHKLFKWNVPFTAQSGTGWEFDLMILASAFTVFLAGPGMWAIDLML